MKGKENWRNPFVEKNGKFHLATHSLLKLGDEDHHGDAKKESNHLDDEE